MGGERGRGGGEGWDIAHTFLDLSATSMSGISLMSPNLGFPTDHPGPTNTNISHHSNYSAVTYVCVMHSSCVCQVYHARVYSYLLSTRRACSSSQAWTTRS